jgi:hypothetical protein
MLLIMLSVKIEVQLIKITFSLSCLIARYGCAERMTPDEMSGAAATV